MNKEKEYYAHIVRKEEVRKEPLETHLANAAFLSEKFASEFHNGKTGRFLGGIHDIGKRTIKFQKVLKHTAHHIDHAIVAGIVIYNQRGLFTDTELRRHLAGIAAAHHSDLECIAADYEEIEDYTDEDEMETSDDSKENALSSEREYLSVISWAVSHKILYSLEPEENFIYSSMNLATQKMLYTRMLFSCLVDADYTSTAAFEKNIPVCQLHERHVQADEYLSKLERYRSRFILNKSAKGQTSLINQLRNLVYENCAQAGQNLDPGVYTLTAPTGTGKTLALIKFALEQAKRNHQGRIFVILPYLSIITQNAAEYRKIFGDNVVLEDDSQTEYTENTKELSDRWNSPVIVTTTVNFFETLFASRSVKLRKLHQIANSVIVYDECQTLPNHVLDATLETVSDLPRYGTTVLFSTATLPAYGYRRNLQNWHPVEIIEDFRKLFKTYETIKNTDVIFDTETVYEPDTLLNYFDSTSRQILFVVNTVKKAEAVYGRAVEMYGEENCIILTSRMCSQHKLDVIDNIKCRVQNGKPAYVISTQCIEAGVDIDLPVGCREFAPLSSVIQTAGRINRNGRTHGKFLVFRFQDESTKGGFPSTDYRNASGITRSQAENPGIQLYDTDSLHNYYRSLYSSKDTREDSRDLQRSIIHEEYKETCANYKLIEKEKTYNVIVPYEACMDLYEGIRTELEDNGYILTKRIMKGAQKITVSLYDRDGLDDCGNVLALPGQFGNENSNWYFMRDPSFYTQKGYTPQRISTMIF